MNLNDRLNRLEKRLSCLTRDKPDGWQRKCKRITRIITALIKAKGKERRER